MSCSSGGDRAYKNLCRDTKNAIPTEGNEKPSSTEAVKESVGSSKLQNVIVAPNINMMTQKQSRPITKKKEG